MTEDPPSEFRPMEANQGETVIGEKSRGAKTGLSGLTWWGEGLYTTAFIDSALCLLARRADNFAKVEAKSWPKSRDSRAKVSPNSAASVCRYSIGYGRSCREPPPLSGLSLTSIMKPPFGVQDIWSHCPVLPPTLVQEVPQSISHPNRLCILWLGRAFT